MKKRITYVLILMTLVLSSILASRWLPKSSFANDAKDIEIEAQLEKYINYTISEDNKGTLIAYQINCIPVQNSGIELTVNAIDNILPSYVKVINKETGIEQQSEYNNQTGTIKTTANNSIVFCYYDTYDENETERELQLDITAKTEQEENTINEVSKSFSVTVTENIGSLTSISYQTENIYNGYMKANQNYETSYNTNYKEKQQIIISKKDAQDKLALVESNTFNENNLIYKNTKINKENLKNLVGENGQLEILDQNQNLIETINQETEWEENGTYTINYENEPEALILKTSKIQNEGILLLEHEKQIKAEISTIEKNQIITKTNLIGIQEIEQPKTEQETEQEENQETTKIVEKQIYNESNEETIEIKDAKTNINMELSEANWTNKQQNEVTFDIHLNSNTSKDNLFKNPTIKINMPKEVEKVIIQNSSIFHGNELELQETYIETDENNNIQIIANLQGEQTKYSENNLDLTTDIKITATVILKKDIESKETIANLEYTNQYTPDGKTEFGNQKYAIQLESYQEENTDQEDTNQENQNNNDYVPIATENKANTDALKLEVLPVKGDTPIANNDTVYEGEYIKYNIKVTNTSNETIENVKIVGNVPEGTTYGELEADYHNYAGKYEYNFMQEVKDKEIEVGKLEPNKSKTIFYEVKVNDLEENKQELEINTIIKSYIGEIEDSKYELKNIIKPAELKIFVKSYIYGSRDTWNYFIHVTSEEDKEVEVTIKLPKELNPQYIYNYSDKCKIVEYNDENKPKDNIFTLKVNTNTDYYINTVFEHTRLKQETEESKIELSSAASVKGTNIIYHSNENRVVFEYENVAISMTSETEGEEVKYGEEINYEIKVKNIGKTNIDRPEYKGIKINLRDILPKNIKPISVTYDNWEQEVKEEIEDGEVVSVYPTGKFNKLEPETKELTRTVDEDENRLPNVDIELTIPYEETVTIQIKAQADAVEQKTKIENSATVSGNHLTSKTSNIVTHTILPFNYIEPEDPDNPEEPEEPEEPDIPEEPEEPEEPDNPDNPKYNISGIAWVDENEDGKRQTTEKGVGDITTILVEANDISKIKATTKTTASGSYNFTEIEKGNYLILFQYDNNRYHITQYQKNGVDNSLNSDAINKQINLNGQKINVGMIEINNLKEDTSNLDIGLLENKICNLKIDKTITKVSVKTSTGTRQYDYNNEKLAKIEIKAKEIENATVTIEYKIVITNNGEIATTVEKIIDELPKELNLSMKSSEQWSKKGNNQFENNLNQKLEPGESTSVTLTATKNMTENETGTFTNKVKIEGTTNTYKIDDNNTEDDTSQAEIIISVSTGVAMYISIGIIVAIVLGLIIWLASKYGITKIGKISLFAILFTILIMSQEEKIIYARYSEDLIIDYSTSFRWIDSSSESRDFERRTR